MGGRREAVHSRSSLCQDALSDRQILDQALCRPVDRPDPRRTDAHPTPTDQQYHGAAFPRLEKRQPAAGGDGVAVKDLAAHLEGNPTGEKPGQCGIYPDPPGWVFYVGTALCHNRQQARDRCASKVSRERRQSLPENEEADPPARLSTENKQPACEHSNLMA